LECLLGFLAQGYPVCGELLIFKQNQQFATDTRANEKLAAGEVVLAYHLADWSVTAAPDDKSAHEARMKIYAARADREESKMAHGIFRSAVVESAAKAGIDAPDDKRSA